jgi:ribokinase
LVVIASKASATAMMRLRSLLDAERAAEAVRGRGPRLAVIKLGDRGAFYAARDGRGHVPAVPVQAVDTTAAGGAFAAALGVVLGEGLKAADAVAFATRAAGLKVSRISAQAGMPTRADVEMAMDRYAQGR